MFYSFYILCFDSWGLANARGIASTRVSQLLKRTTGSTPFICKPASQTQTTSFLGFLHCKSLFLCPNNLRATYQTTRQSLYAQSLLKLSKVANPKPAYVVLPIPSHGNHNRASVHVLPCSLRRPLEIPHVSPHGMPCLFFLGICEYNNILPPW